MLTFSSFFSSHDPSPTTISTLSLHDALPIYPGPANLATLVLEHNQQIRRHRHPFPGDEERQRGARDHGEGEAGHERSEEHTSELQSRSDLVCRLLLEKKKKNIQTTTTQHLKQ